ncbi:hypothetical protein, partial [Sphingomonas oligophenolica]|uniref:hypothetical protein n=1 Tax=Sphingomonas oligophenolica TaxID=301154 RepID=UPI0031CFE4D3
TSISPTRPQSRHSMKNPGQQWEHVRGDAEVSVKRPSQRRQYHRKFPAIAPKFPVTKGGEELID